MTCRSPKTIKRATRDAALKAITSLYRSGKGSPDLRAYPCGDHWHVGHSAVHFKQRIRKALRAGRGPQTTYARNRRTKR